MVGGDKVGQRWALVHRYFEHLFLIEKKKVENCKKIMNADGLSILINRKKFKLQIVINPFI